MNRKPPLLWSRRTLLRRGAWAAGAAALGAPAPSSRAEDSPLASHRIAALEFRTVRIPWPRQVGRNAMLGIHGRGPSPEVAVLRSDQGALGWGHLQSDRKSAEALRDLLAGKSIAELIDPAAGILDRRLHPVDVPLHDLAAGILGVPVWHMLGGRDALDHPKVYSGMIYFDDLDPAEEPGGIDKVLENCRWDHEYGYRQLKIKIGRGNKWMPTSEGLQRDIDVVRAIHGAFPDCELLVDGNNGFTVETFVRFLEGIEGIPLFWIEEPFHETIAEWTVLRNWLVTHGREKAYRADGEAAPDVPVLEALEKDHTLNLRLTDICGLGFTEWRRLMPKLIAGGIAASPHTWGSALKTVYTAHLAAALGNTPTVEGVTTAGGDVDFEENRIVEARFQPSSKPGFGLGLPA
ncbi:MAG TPA: enolase C-terminal domain-like protein [Verrucomicrobiales bacterium]|nr:enolase C-terminal domain-like protein [Verrucomicrobiales bacterium]